MPFNIREFQSQILKNGYSEASTFIVDITPPAALLDSEVSQIFRFYCRSVQLPPLDITTLDVAVQGFGAPTKRPSAREFSIIPATFLVDGQHKILRFFQNWSQLVMNYDRTQGQQGSSYSLRPFEINYKTDYAGTMSIIMFNDKAGQTMTYELGGVFPQSIGSIDLAWDAEDQMLLPVGFAFDILKISGDAYKNPSVTSETANSALSYFSSENSFAEANPFIARPFDVQQAVSQTAAALPPYI